MFRVTFVYSTEFQYQNTYRGSRLQNYDAKRNQSQ